MELMTSGEHSIQLIGDNCVNFARQMVTHHWGAIVMSLDTINMAPWESTITPIAQDIVVDQFEQIGQLKDWLEDQDLPWMGPNDWTWVPNPDEDYAFGNTDFGRINKLMNRGMHGTPLTGDLNIDLARMMIPHHWGAITMAEELISANLCDDDMMALAVTIHQTQKEQLEEFRDWLEYNGWPWVGKDWTVNPAIDIGYGDGEDYEDNGYEDREDYEGYGDDEEYVGYEDYED